MAAEAEGVIEDGVDLHFAGFVRGVIQVARGIGVIQIDGGRNDAVLDRLDADDAFDRAGGAEHVAQSTLGGGDDQFFRVIREN